MAAPALGRRGVEARRTAEARVTRAAVPTLALATLLPLAACAKEEPPPGVLPDGAPPELERVRPADGSVVAEFDGELRLEFDEPISVSRRYEEEIDSSPAYRYRMSVGHSDIRLRPAGGWRQGVVYAFRFPAEISDILGNQRKQELTVTFSTGPSIPGTRVGGRLLDRVEGGPVREGRVLFLPLQEDSVPYTASSDEEGRFELRALPPGRYRALGFRDFNGDRDLQRRLEAYDSLTFELEDPTAPADLDLRVVEPDTTPPVLGDARVPDSLTVRLVFDDHLAPEQDLSPSAFTVRDTTDDTEIGVAEARLAVPDTARPGRAAEEAAPGAEPARDTVAAAAGADTAAAAAARAGQEGRAAALPRPSREVELRLERPLRPGGAYRAEARGLRNLRGLTGGGSVAFSYVPSDTVPGAAPPGGAKPDTTAPGGAPADGPAPDAAWAPPVDTMAAAEGPASRGRVAGADP